MKRLNATHYNEILLGLDDQGRKVTLEICLYPNKDGVTCLSISGYAQYRPHQDYSYCGQIKEVLFGTNGPKMRRYFIPKRVRRQILGIWNAYHLNDLQSACPHQQRLQQTYATHPGAVCPACGWKLGHGWMTKTIPQNVIDAILSWQTPSVK